MEVEFRNVTVTIEADSPREAYALLCSALGTMNDLGDWSTDTFVTHKNGVTSEEHDASEAYPVEHPELWLCIDCTLVAVNDDATGVEDDEREAEVRAAVHAMGPGLACDTDPDSDAGDDPFSWQPCDCCGSRLGGGRTRFALIQTPEEARLEYLRGELRAERISYGELAELQGLVDHIKPHDVELLEAAGVPEFPDDGDDRERMRDLEAFDAGTHGELPLDAAEAEELATLRSKFAPRAIPDDTPSLENCDDAGTGEGRFHGRM